MTGSGNIGDGTADIDTIAALAESALAQGREAEAIASVRDGAARHRSALLWQWTGLLQRSIDEHEAALDSFANAARIDPTNARIAQGHAHTALEAGVPAVELYERALRLAPKSGPVIIGLGAARMAAGDGDGAAADLARTLHTAPMWLQGHVQLGQLLSTLGRRDEVTHSIEHALARFPTAQPLWETLLNIQLRRGAYESLDPILARARGSGVQSPEFAIYEAIHQAEFDPRDFPPGLFEAPASLDDVLDSWRVRHLLRIGRPEEAIPILDRGLKEQQSAELWSYAATTWRLVGDRRASWLADDPALVRTIDLSETMGDRDSLAEVLRRLHARGGEYLDQSVRGGTQTDGPLFCRIEPEIRTLRKAVIEAVSEYRSNLPQVDPEHPLLRQARDRPIRFAGSWSVRLRSGGRHSNHVHPQGWISSALYVSLPERQSGDAEDSGWFTLGQPDEKLGLEVEPARKIEPHEGRLILFPSWMWHGTVPFLAQERLTVAFDVAPPR